MCNSFLRYFPSNPIALYRLNYQSAKNSLFFLLWIAFAEILAAYENDSFINPVYIYRDQSTGSQITSQKFNLAYPFEKCGLAIVQFENEEVLSVINTKGERIFQLSNSADNLHIIGNGFIQVQINNSSAEEAHYDLYQRGNRIASGFAHEFREIRGTTLLSNYNYNLDFVPNQTMLIDSTGQIIAQNLVYKSDRNGFLYFVNEIKNGKKSKLEIYNSLGKLLFTSPNSVYDIETNDYFPKNIQILQTDEHQKYYCFILGSEKNTKKNRFVAISENGNIVNETLGVEEFTIKKDWVKIIRFDKKEADNIALFHPQKGYFPKILMGRFLRNQEKPSFIYQNTQKQMCLYNNTENFVLNTPKSNFSRFVQLENGVFLESDYEGKQSSHAQFWLDFDTKKWVPVKTFAYDKRKNQSVYIDIKATKLVCSGKSSNIFSSKDLGLSIENCRISHCTQNYFGLEFNDVLYFFDYQGRSFNQNIVESEIWNLDSEIDLEIEPALIFTPLNSNRSKIIGVPSQEFKKIKDALAPTGNILAQDTSNHIVLIPLGSRTNSNALQPQRIASDSIFDYEFYHPLLNDDGDFNYEHLNLNAAKLNTDIIYNDRLGVFWVFYKGNFVKKGNYSGSFTSECVSRFKGMNLTALLNDDQIPFIFKTGKEVYLTKMGPNEWMYMDSIASQFTQFRTSKHLLYNRSLNEDISQSINLYSYFYKLEEIYYNPDTTFAYLDDLLWIYTDSGRVGIWNLKNQEWLVDPNLGTTAGVFASERLILLNEKRSNIQTIKSLTGKPLITFGANTELKIFDEGEEMGLFIESKTPQPENTGISFFQTYRIDSEYGIRTHFPNYNSLPEQWKNTISQNSDEGYNQNIYNGLFGILLNLNNEIPIYYERDGTLLLDFKH